MRFVAHLQAGYRGSSTIPLVSRARVYSWRILLIISSFNWNVLSATSRQCTIESPITLVHVVLPLERLKIGQGIILVRIDVIDFPSVRRFSLAVEIAANPSTTWSCRHLFWS